MKRAAIIIFIIFIVPVWFVACNPCGKGFQGGPGRWTWAGADIRALATPDSVDFFVKGDTVKTDSVYFNVFLEDLFISIHQQNSSSFYSALACSPALPVQRNNIVNIIFGLCSVSSMGHSMDSSLVLDFDSRNFDWKKDKQGFIESLAGTSANQNSKRIKAKFLSPHDSKPVQIIMLAIKQTGDTIKAMSDEIVLK